MLGRIVVVLYNNYSGAPPLVVIPRRTGPLWEAFSFWVLCFSSSLLAIIVPNSRFVKPSGSSSSRSTASHLTSDFDRSHPRAAAHPLNLTGDRPILTKQCGL